MDLNRLVHKDQTIKIVPSIEDSLQQIGLNTDLDENSIIWLEQLKTTWKTWKKSAALENHIETFFQSTNDPHRIALAFAVKCPDIKDCKPNTLPFFIIESLQKWCAKSGFTAIESLKLPAFHIAIQQRNQHFLNLISKTYKLDSIKDTLIPIIKNMIHNDNCKKATQVVIALELFNEIPVQDLLFPLILQDKANMIDEYLSECPDQVKPFIFFLDNLLDKKFNLTEFVQNYIEDNKIHQVNYQKLHYKPLGKLVARLCNKFKIPVDTCKNLSKNRTTGGLRYLIYQRYIEHNVSSSVWEDLVKDSLKQNVEAAEEFIDLLVDYDRKEALKWANYLNLPEDLIPSSLKNMTTQAIVDNVENEDWDSPALQQPVQQYYELCLPRDSIIIIDSGEKFYDLMISKLSECNVISIDCEWKPSFGAKQSKVALIQIATGQYVYLIDTILLNNKSYVSFWYTFSRTILDNPEIIKLGFGLEQDFKEMRSSILGLNNMKGEGLIDIGMLWKSLLNCGLNLPSENAGGSSLSNLVQLCFGLPLEKSEQCSNWEIRPLRNTQISYAALDAHVLIEIYNYLHNLCKGQGIDFDDICNDIIFGKKTTKCTKKIGVAEQMHASFSQLVIKEKEIKFLVDTTLSHLLPYFRYCGIDSIGMSSCMLWHDIINLAISEDRFILLSKLKYTPTTKFPQSSILDLGKCNINEQLQKLSTTYNLCINKKSVFGRCIYCNGLELRILSQNDDIFNHFQSSPDINVCVEDVENDEDDDYMGYNYDNFLSDSDNDEDLYQPANTKKKEVPKTKHGIPIEFNVGLLRLNYQKPIRLCETCGKILSEDDSNIKSISEVVMKIFSTCE